MKMNIAVLLIGLTQLTACQVDVKGETVNTPQAQEVIAAKKDLSVGTNDQYVENILEFSKALPNGAEHTWTWVAPSNGVLKINSPTYVTIGCSTTPFSTKVFFASSVSPEFEQALPANFNVEKDVTYKVTTKIYANDCIGANYSISATFKAQ